MVSFHFPAIGTEWQIDIQKDISKEHEVELFSAIKNRINEFDSVYSRFRSDSLVSRIAHETGEFVFPKDSQKIFELYYDLYVLTDGLFSPFVGQLLVDAGYDAEYSLVQKKQLTTPLLWEQYMLYSYPQLVVKKPTLLDFGAGGKGYLIDIVAGVIESFGVFEYCIDAGGDIVHKGTSPLSVGLENPENFDEAIGVFSLSNGSLCGSAGNRRVWGDFTHIINPATRTSPRNILAVWVYASSGLLADSLATCLFFCSAERFISRYDFEYLIIREDHSIEKSKNFHAHIFTQ